VPEKERAVFDVALADAENVVDAAIGLVRKVEVAVSGHDKLLRWLTCRDADGYFPESALL
jgi:hypothetical protein